MPNTFIPRIKATTAKNIAKGILSDKSGKKISDTKFKEILRKDKSLKKFAYIGKNTTLDKFKTKKFFNTILDTAKTHEKFKVNKLAAKKLGLNINRQGQASQIGLNKIYQHAAKEEISAAETGPSKQELRKQERHEKAIQQLHKQERASDRKEQYDKEAKEKQSDTKDSSSQSNSAPIRQSSTSGVALSQSGPSQNNYLSMDIDDSKVNTGNELPKLLLPPLNNLSPTQPNIDIITKKIEISVKQKIINLKSFNIIGPEILTKSLMSLGMDKMPEPTNEDFLKKLAMECGAQLFIFGTVQKNTNILLFNLEIINSETDQKITLANIEQTSIDLFDLEKKINWQIDDALLNENPNSPNNIPSVNKAIDLPI